MAFQLLTPLFTKVDQVASVFITDMTQRSLMILTPIVITGLTLSFILYGLLIIRGLVDVPVTDFLAKYFRIGLIISLVFTSGFYQSRIIEVIQKLPDELAVALISDLNSRQGEGAAALIDQAAGKGFNQATKAFDKAGFFKTDGFTYAIFGIVIMLTTAILMAIGSAYLLLAKIGLSLLVALGPFFIASLLFSATKPFFEKWLTQILNYALLTVLFSAVFSFMVSIFADYINDVDFNNKINTGYTLGGAMVLSISMIVILLQLPSLAAALAGGLALSYTNELRSIKQGTASAYRGVKAGSQAIAGGLRQTYGYFRGSQAPPLTSGSLSKRTASKPSQAQSKGGHKG